MKGFAGTQRGAALFVSLMLLLVLTILAISSMQGTVLQEQMVSAQRDGQIAFEGAEHAMREAELSCARRRCHRSKIKMACSRPMGLPPWGRPCLPRHFGLMPIRAKRPCRNPEVRICSPSSLVTLFRCWIRPPSPLTAGLI